MAQVVLSKCKPGFWGRKTAILEVGNLEVMMPATQPDLDETILDEDARRYYCSAMEALQKGEVPFLVGGAFAFSRYTGIIRHTKDFDIFLKFEDLDQARQALEAAGYRTEVTFPHWLAKAYHPGGEYFIDLIFSSGNGIARVDDSWYEHAVAETVLDQKVQIIPPEEMLWSKSFVMERERYDGADVAHLLRACADKMDWARVLARFDDKWRVLLSHLILFGFVYPELKAKIPASVMDDLLNRVKADSQEPAGESKVCHGTLVSRQQYLVDINEWGYKDGRLPPEGHMKPADIADWTDAITSRK